MNINNKPQLRQLPLDQLQRGQYQPRRDFNAPALQELADSIRSAGLIQPLVVRSIGDQQYEIIAGERRWRAAQIAQLDEIPCLVRQISDEQAATIATIENIQREDLNPIEEAQAFLRLVDEFQYYHEEVAAIVGKSRAKISNALRLLKLEPRLQTLLIDQQLSSGHGKVLAGMPEKMQWPLAQKCLEQQWSVRKLEIEAKKIQTQGSAIQSAIDPNQSYLEREVSEQFGAQVKLESDADKRSGWLKIRYSSHETLSGLLEKMGVNNDAL